jgi:hypothetical protein
MVLGLIQLGFAIVMGTLLFDIDWGRSLVAVVTVLLAWAGFNASPASLLSNLARSPAQVAAWASSSRWCWRPWVEPGGP